MFRLIIPMIILIIQDAKLVELAYTCRYYPYYTYPNYDRTSETTSCTQGCCGYSCPTSKSDACCSRNYGSNYCSSISSSYYSSGWWSYMIVVPIIVFTIIVSSIVYLIVRLKKRNALMTRIGTNPIITTPVQPGTIFRTYPATSSTSYPTVISNQTNPAYSSYSSNTQAMPPPYAQNNNNYSTGYSMPPQYNNNFTNPPPIGFNPSTQQLNPNIQNTY